MHRVSHLLVSLFSLALLFISSGALGKDLTHRLGVGYANPFSTDTPGIAARYYQSEDMNFTVTLGVDTESDASEFGLLGGVNKVIFKEPNLNFYMGASAGLVSQEIAGVSDSGFELNGIVGAEFFFTGLDSLAFLFEAGVGITSIGDGVRFRTIGNHPLNAGIIFYF